MERCKSRADDERGWKKVNDCSVKVNTFQRRTEAWKNLRSVSSLPEPGGAVERLVGTHAWESARKSVSKMALSWVAVIRLFHVPLGTRRRMKHDICRKSNPGGASACLFFFISNNVTKKITSTRLFIALVSLGDVTDRAGKRGREPFHLIKHTIVRRWQAD